MGEREGGGRKFRISARRAERGQPVDRLAEAHGGRLAGQTVYSKYRSVVYVIAPCPLASPVE
jgi:hypothetical protein